MKVNGIDELKGMVGKELGTSSWFTVDQERINTFADATDDHQWIHVDLERAKGGPFGGPIAHGYLTLSLVVPMFFEVLQVEGVAMGVNYGLNKVRFPAPVPAGPASGSPPRWPRSRTSPAVSRPWSTRSSRSRGAPSPSAWPSRCTASTSEIRAAARRPGR